MCCVKLSRLWSGYFSHQSFMDMSFIFFPFSRLLLYFLFFLSVILWLYLSDLVLLKIQSLCLSFYCSYTLCFVYIEGMRYDIGIPSISCTYGRIDNYVDSDLDKWPLCFLVLSLKWSQEARRRNTFPMMHHVNKTSCLKNAPWPKNFNFLIFFHASLWFNMCNVLKFNNVNMWPTLMNNLSVLSSIFTNPSSTSLVSQSPKPPPPSLFLNLKPVWTGVWCGFSS